MIQRKSVSVNFQYVLSEQTTLILFNGSEPLITISLYGIIRCLIKQQFIRMSVGAQRTSLAMLVDCVNE
jgi:hypothetical protein